MGQARIGSNGKLVLFLLGGLLSLAVVFNLIEKLVPHDTRAATSAASGAVPGEEAAPIRPKLSREGPGTVLVDAGFFHHSRFRFNGDGGTEQADAVFACLKAGIEREFGPEDSPTSPIEGTDRSAQRREMRALMKKMQERCMEQVVIRRPGAPDRPQPPTPPEP